MTEKNNQDWQSKFWRKFFIGLVILCFLNPVISIVKESCANSKADANLTPVSEPPSGYVFSGMFWGDCIAPLEIETRGTDGYYFKFVLLESYDEDFKRTEEHIKVETKAAFYIRGGDTIEFDIPLGKYEVYYATGKTWYGEEYLFGSKTVYNKIGQQLSFYIDSNGDVHGHKISLKMTSDGNLDVDTIYVDDFPK